MRCQIIVMVLNHNDIGNNKIAETTVVRNLSFWLKNEGVTHFIDNFPSSLIKND